uniref:WW domain binding protein 11 n=1 Tax=Amphilophus citrinellus TaxID=61819 RepID=A0A3Q0T0I4_AMPCI
MGRRSTSSTKSGKFMNPTDQARKEARKRELKKNKKQRMMVRAAVLKMKDPRQIIRDMEKLDEMEFNPVQQPLLNEKVLRDKRKKLRETFERIVRLYERENPETYKELRKLELDYETKRGQLALYFDSVKVCWEWCVDPYACQWQKQHTTTASMGVTNPAQMGAVPQPSMKTKDQVYEAFMREMEGLL